MRKVASLRSMAAPFFGMPRSGAEPSVKSAACQLISQIGASSIWMTARFIGEPAPGLPRGSEVATPGAHRRDPTRVPVLRPPFLPYPSSIVMQTLFTSGL